MNAVVDSAHRLPSVDTVFEEYDKQQYQENGGTRDAAASQISVAQAAASQPSINPEDEVIRDPSLQLVQRGDSTEAVSPSGSRDVDVLIKKAARTVQKRLSNEPRKKHLQMWYGSIKAIRSKYVIARLVDPSGMSPDVDAEIPIEQVDDNESAYLQEGAVFYLNVVMLVSEAGRKSITSNLRFKRLRAFDQGDQKLVEKYKTMFENIGQR